MLKKSSQKVLLVSVALLLSNMGVAENSGAYLIESQILPGYGDEHTEKANELVEEILIRGIRGKVLSEPNSRFRGQSQTFRKTCFHGWFDPHGHSIATFAVAGGLPKLYRWARNQGEWELTYNKANESPISQAIEHGLVYMAEVVWSGGYNRYSYLKRRPNRIVVENKGYGYPFASMVERKWPLSGFEAAWAGGERFHSREERDAVVKYLQENETDPENNTRLQTLIDKFDPEVHGVIRNPGVLAYSSRITGTGGCKFHGPAEGALRGAIRSGEVTEQVVKSFHINGLPLLHYLSAFQFTGTIKQLLEKEYAPDLISQRDSRGRDAFLAAVEAHNREIASDLLQADSTLATQLIPDQDGYQHSGDSPLHFAMRKSAPREIIAMLLNASSHSLLTYKNAEDLTPAALLEQLYDNKQITGDSYLTLREAIKQ